MRTFNPALCARALCAHNIYVYYRNSEKEDLELAVWSDQSAYPSTPRLCDLAMFILVVYAQQYIILLICQTGRQCSL